MTTPLTLAKATNALLQTSSGNGVSNGIALSTTKAMFVVRDPTPTAPNQLTALVVTATVTGGVTGVTTVSHDYASVLPVLNLGDVIINATPLELIVNSTGINILKISYGSYSSAHGTTQMLGFVILDDSGNLLTTSPLNVISIDANNMASTTYTAMANIFPGYTAFFYSRYSAGNAFLSSFQLYALSGGTQLANSAHYDLTSVTTATTLEYLIYDAHQFDLNGHVALVFRHVDYNYVGIAIAGPSAGQVSSLYTFGTDWADIETASPVTMVGDATNGILIGAFSQTGVATTIKSTWANPYTPNPMVDGLPALGLTSNRGSLGAANNRDSWYHPGGAFVDNSVVFATIDITANPYRYSLREVTLPSTVSASLDFTIDTSLLTSPIANATGDIKIVMINSQLAVILGAYSQSVGNGGYFVTSLLRGSAITPGFRMTRRNDALGIRPVPRLNYNGGLSAKPTSRQLGRYPRISQRDGSGSTSTYT